MQPNPAAYITATKAASLTRLTPTDIDALASQGEFDAWEDEDGRLLVSLASVDSFRLRRQHYRHSAADLAELFGCNARTIRTYAKRYGLGVRHADGRAGGYRFNDEDIAALREALRPSEATA